MPSVEVDEVEHAINDNEVISELEHVMSDWGAALTEVMQREAEKHPVGTGPLAGWPLSPGAPTACILRSCMLGSVWLIASCCCVARFSLVANTWQVNCLHGLQRLSSGEFATQLSAACMNSSTCHLSRSTCLCWRLEVQTRIC